VVAYDAELAARVRDEVLGEPGLSEQRMFGGLGFMIYGNLAVAASSQGGLLLRVDPAQTDLLVADPTAERFVMRGRAMNGWLRIDIDATASEAELKQWVDRGVGYARSLPPKSR
jgi:TfoX/Sxy family transcriptional regulator of competence genes